MIKNQLEALSPEQKMHVFTIIEQLSSQADLEIEANGGSYDCKAGKIKKACNGIISIDKLIRGDEGAESGN